MKSVTIKNHQESLKEPSVVWEKYTRDVKNNPNRYFVFYEGKDRQYYDCRIQQFAENFNTYEVGGKSKVLELVNKFTHEEGYKLKNKLFFIDLDCQIKLDFSCNSEKLGMVFDNSKTS